MPVKRLPAKKALPKRVPVKRQLLSDQSSIDRLHIGISGWSYADWRDVFYTSGVKQSDWLAHYARYFSCTEINSSFYHLPRATTVQGWAGKVPANFLFCPKVSKYLTHIKRLLQPEEPLSRFFEVFDLIKDQLGPILLQLPPSLPFDRERVTHLFQLLTSVYNEYAFAIEPRHHSWFEEEPLAIMRAHNVTIVISQSGVGFPYTEQITSNNVYLRFHGPCKLYDSNYEDEMLLEYAAKIKKWLDEGLSVWVFFNNCYYGMAINNAETLEAMIRSL